MSLSESACKEVGIMKHERSKIYAVLSIACPIVTVASVYLLQTRAHSDFWESVKQSDDGVQHGAAGLMVLAEFGDLLLYSALACVAGLLLALRSIQLRRNLTSLGCFCLSVNGAPLLIAAFLWIRGALIGW
jgi:hypothetical protein